MQTDSPVTVQSCTMPSALGDLTLLWNESGLLAVEFADQKARIDRFVERHGLTIDSSEFDPDNVYVIALRRYFEGDIDAVADLPVKMYGQPFQVAVWNTLLTIPCGETRSYGEIAESLGKPGAARAVGAANGQNPIGIVVPCHRVIGADGKLTGYAGGIDRKQWLLEHEGAISSSPSQTGFW